MDPSKPDERRVLIDSVNTQYLRAKDIAKVSFDESLGKEARLYYINGDHNNMANVVTGFYEARGVKPIVINLDFHSDARKAEDGPHSGTWLSDGY